MQNSSVVAAELTTPSAASVRARVLGLAWPVMAESILQTLTQIVSMMLVGHLGAQAVASIGLSMQPLFVFQSLFMGAGVAATAVVARATGASNRDEIGRASAQALLTSTLIALAGVLFIVLRSRWLVVMMGAEPDVIAQGAQYLLIMVPGLFFMWISTVLTGAMRGAGDTKTPMIINVTISLISFALNFVLVYGWLGFPALGVMGAGLATTIARVIGGFILFIPYFANRTTLPFRSFREFRWDSVMQSRLMRVAVGGVGERLIMSLAGVLYVRMVAVLGTTAYAAHSIGTNAEMISVMPGLAFGVAATTLVGQHLGAGRPDLAERDSWEALKVGCVVVGIIGLFYIFMPGPFLRLYSSDPVIIRYASLYLIMMGFCQVHQAFGYVLSGSLRGAGDTNFVMWLTLLGAWVMRVGLTYLLIMVFHTGLVGAWWAMTADTLTKAILAFWRFRKGAWKRVAV